MRQKTSIKRNNNSFNRQRLVSRIIIISISSMLSLSFQSKKCFWRTTLFQIFIDFKRSYWWLKSSQTVFFLPHQLAGTFIEYWTAQILTTQITVEKMCLDYSEELRDYPKHIRIYLLIGVYLFVLICCSIVSSAVQTIWMYS